MEATIVLAKPLNETQCNASYSGISECSLTMGKYLPCLQNPCHRFKNSLHGKFRIRILELQLPIHAVLQ